MTEAEFGGLGASGQTRLPAARSAGLIVTASEDELVIYDVAAKHIHHLNAVSAAVWQLCDGRRTVAEVAAAATETLGARVDADTVAIAAAKLDDAKLLAEAIAIPRMSRRIFGRRMAMLGAAAVPAVVSITAPLASASASDCFGTPVDCPGNGRAVNFCCMVDYGIGACDAAGNCNPRS